MDKNSRDIGERYLKKWGQGILGLQKIQEEINKIRKEKDLFQTVQIENKSDMIEIYNTVIDNKLENLKNNITNYKFIDDIINDLEEYQKDIIKFRYIHKNSWQAVALKAHISLRQCFNIKNKVIELILTELEKNQDSVKNI